MNIIRARATQLERWYRTARLRRDARRHLAHKMTAGQYYTRSARRDARWQDRFLKSKG